MIKICYDAELLDKLNAEEGIALIASVFAEAILFIITLLMYVYGVDLGYILVTSCAMLIAAVGTICWLSAIEDKKNIIIDYFKIEENC